MKKFHKIFMAVAAVAAVGCTTDVTEDLGVNLNEGQTTLTLSLDDTRTQLGEKADGTYPLTWAENDAISVNGSVSNALAADEAGDKTATFTFKNSFGENPKSYFIAYPAVDGVANQVMFAAEQTHTSNTSFGNNAAVMYGYATDLNNIKLSHLTGVLKIGVVSGTEELTFIKEVRISTVDRKPIAGAFTATYNAETEKMELTPAEGATEVITYKAASDAGFPVPVGTSTSENPAYIHIAVPAGVYGELYVTLESADGVMYKTVTTDSSKPINAGTVREFSNNIEFVPTDEAEVFVISNYADLYEYKNAVEEGSNLNAVLVNDIEITDHDTTFNGNWESINAPAYTGIFNGNGYAIKGLKAPLFNVTAASFKGLHLDVVVEEKVNPNFGAFARQLVANGNAPKVEHCSVSGSIKINTDITPAKANQLPDGAVGVFCGIAKGVLFENCTNNAAIEVAQYTTTTEMWGAVGGIVGYTNIANSIVTNFTNCTNNGAITFSETSGKTTVCFAGIVGACEGEAINIAFDNCCNNGKITMANNSVCRDCNVGGFLAYSKGASDARKTFNFNNNSTNSGDFEIKGTISGTSRIGGFVAYARTAINLNFNGKTISSGDIDYGCVKADNSRIGGLVGVMNEGGLLHIYNYYDRPEGAKITITGSIDGSLFCGNVMGYAVTGAQYIRIFHHTTSNSGNIEIGATVTGSCLVGGINGCTENTRFHIGNDSKLINNGNILINENAVLKGNIQVGGIAGLQNNYALGVISAGDGAEKSTGQAINTGEIRFEGETQGDCYIGGLFGQMPSSMTYLTSLINVGNIYFAGKINSDGSQRFGGAAGYIGKNKGASNIQCHCDIFAVGVTKDGDNYTFTPVDGIGLITGRVENGLSESSTSNCKLGGSIAANATIVDGVVTPTWTPSFTATNIFDYVIGARSGRTSFNGVSFLASENNIVWGDYGK